MTESELVGKYVRTECGSGMFVSFATMTLEADDSDEWLELKSTKKDSDTPGRLFIHLRKLAWLQVDD